MSAPMMNVNTVPSESDLAGLASFLVSLPFLMQNVGHKSIEGHAYYVRGQSILLQATLDWIVKQTPANWTALVAAWGGEEQFLAIRTAIMRATFADFNPFKVPA